jgi:hypothetical protein
MGAFALLAQTEQEYRFPGEFTILIADGVFTRHRGQPLRDSEGCLVSEPFGGAQAG